jgi:FMN phosphatase YigB (HAD superfamily)
LAELQIDPPRALHVGDDDADREAAAAAGMWFARTPLSEAVATIL